jgi:hypothetical protein
MQVIEKRQNNGVCSFSAPPTVTVTTGTTIVTDTTTDTITDTVTSTSTYFDTITITLGEICVGPGSSRIPNSPLISSHNDRDGYNNDHDYNHRL